MEQNKPLVSMIVPVFRIDRYVGICIESLIRQTYQSLEIILVDDGSDDRCPEICDLYKTKDCRIKVVHKENGGLVSARKAGLEKANGAYIGYVDGDDWLDHDYIDRMMTDALAYDADVVCAGFTRDLFEQSVKLGNNCDAGVYRGEALDKLKEHMLSDGEFFKFGITTYVWNKLFRRDILIGPQMNTDNRISIGEDAAVTYPALMNSSCVVVNDCVSYHYRQREDSMLKKSASFSVELANLRILYEYMLTFAAGHEDKYNLKNQITDYILGICLMRSGGRLPEKDSYSTFDDSYYGRNVVIYSAGTFGQQLVNRFNESKHCEIVKWIDDDFWEYRRCCLDVDSVESISEVDFDYVLIATVDPDVADAVKRRLTGLGVPDEKLLTVDCPENIRQTLIQKYLYSNNYE